MIRDDKQDFHFVGFQEENADTIPSEIPCKPVVYVDGTASGHTPTEHHIRKKQIFYSQMTRLHQNNNLNNHNYNKIVKSDWLSTALISALIGQFNRTVRVMLK